MNDAGPRSAFGVSETHQTNRRDLVPVARALDVPACINDDDLPLRLHVGIFELGRVRLGRTRSCSGNWCVPDAPYDSEKAYRRVRD